MKPERFKEIKALYENLESLLLRDLSLQTSGMIGMVGSLRECLDEIERLHKREEEWNRLSTETINNLHILDLNLKILEAHRRKLEKFKSYVHTRLDDAGIPANPEPVNNAKSGCRIEGRLNYLINLAKGIY